MTPDDRRLRRLEQRVTALETGRRRPHGRVPADAGAVMARIRNSQPVTADEQARHRAELLNDLAAHTARPQEEP